MNDVGCIKRCHCRFRAQVPLNIHNHLAVPCNTLQIHLFVLKEVLFKSAEAGEYSGIFVTIFGQLTPTL